MIMRNIWFAILIIGIISVLGFILLQEDNSGEIVFNQVELSSNNSIINNTQFAYYDTILSVGLDALNVKGATVVIDNLSEPAKENFGGDLRAHVRFFNGIFYLFLGDVRKSESFDVLSHEMVHITQYLDGNLVYENDLLTWMGQDYNLETIEYDERPWEREAYSLQTDLSREISKILIK